MGIGYVRQKNLSVLPLNVPQITFVEDNSSIIADILNIYFILVLNI